MDKVKILAIAPYEGLKKVMVSASKKLPNLTVDIFSGNLHTATTLLEGMKDTSYSAIVSRGGTADLLRKTSAIPVVEIPISENEILKAISSAEKFAGKIYVIGFPSITSRAQTLKEILKKNFEILTINSSNEADVVLGQLGQSALVVGDVVTVAKAKERNMNTVLITSAEENVFSAFESALRLKSAFDKLYSQINIYRSILSDVEAVIGVYNANGNCVYNNVYGDKMQYLELLETMSECFKKTGFAETKVYKRIDDCSYKITSKVISADDNKFMAFYSDVHKKTAKADFSYLTVINPNEPCQNDEVYSAGCEYTFRSLGDRLAKISQSSSPVHIIGEHGTGKDCLAHKIYSLSSFANGPLAIIDCVALSKAVNGEKFFTSHDSVLFDTGCTLYFRNIDQLSEEYLQMLSECARYSGITKTNKIICSSVVNPSTATDTARAFCDVYKQLSPLSVVLPPLRERKDDIPTLCMLLINQLNVSLGANVVGLSDEAMNEFLACNWPLNMRQLVLTLKQLVSTTSNTYISVEEVTELLKQTTDKVANGWQIDLDRPLSDIEKDIILKVLDDCGMNQSQTCKRLGISRPTLWRLLKKEQ